MIIYEADGAYDPMIDTGRGSWIQMSRTTLADLLSKFDAAHPEYTDGTREDIVRGWNAAEAARSRIAA
jgi:hypothetical protein